MASVGLTEAEAREAGYQIVSQPASHNERAVCESDLRGFVDVYLDKDARVVGATIMNNRAGEMLSELLVVMENKLPFTKIGLASVMHPYPTYSWSMSMLASDVENERFQNTTGAKIAQRLIKRYS